MSPRVAPNDRVQMVEVPGASLRIRQAGAGRHLVVFAADPPNVVEQYDALLRELAPRVRVVVFEPPGFGRSSLRRGTGFGIEDQARVVADLIETLRRDASDEVTLAFPCVTAHAAAHVAAERPELVDRLVLVQAPSWREQRRWIDRVDPGVLRWPVIGPLVTRVAAKSVARSWYRAATGSQPKAHELLVHAEHALDNGARFPLAQAFRTLWRDGPTEAPRVAQPVLTVWGARDATHRRTDTDTLPCDPRTVGRVELADAGHFPELESPEEFATALLSFLGVRP